jgi:hypothetical protein
MTYHPRGGETSSTWFHKRRLARLQHAPDRPRLGRKGHELGAHRQGLRAYAVQTRARRRAALRRPPLAFRAASSATRSMRTSASAPTGRSSPALAAIPMATTPSGRCTLPAAGPSTVRCSTGTKPSTAPAPRRCSTCADLIESRPTFHASPTSRSSPTLSRRRPHRGHPRRRLRLHLQRAGSQFTINLGKISGDQVKTSWFNPRTGATSEAGTFTNTGTRDFTCPSEGFGSDWVLILDAAN